VGTGVSCVSTSIYEEGFPLLVFSLLSSSSVLRLKCVIQAFTRHCVKILPRLLRSARLATYVGLFFLASSVLLVVSHVRRVVVVFAVVFLTPSVVYWFLQVVFAAPVHGGREVGLWREIICAPPAVPPDWVEKNLQASYHALLIYPCPFCES